jgi:hypothetical protein
MADDLLRRSTRRAMAQLAENMERANRLYRETSPTAKEPEEGLLFMEPREQFDPAILGIGQQFNRRFVVYDKGKVLEILAQDHDCAIEDHACTDDPRDAALEHFEFNIVGAWVGDHTPAFLEKLDDAG